MSERFGIMWAALRLIFVMVVPGTAVAGSAASAVATSPAAPIVRQHPQASLPPPPGAVHRLAVSRVSGPWSPLFAGEGRPQVPVRKAKIYALVLSSFGMLGVIALHRLTDFV